MKYCDCNRSVQGRAVCPTPASCEFLAQFQDPEGITPAEELADELEHALRSRRIRRNVFLAALIGLMLLVIVGWFAS
jgi:hypothetical protein